MRRLALLIAAGTLWLFLAAIPALADGGPHVANTNSGVTSLTADGCAGCHRAHTAQGEALLTAPGTREDFCISCHGSTGNGAATDVVNGIQYVKGSLTAGDKAGNPILGYLRDGGFQMAHLGTSDGEVVRVGYYRAKDTVSARFKVPVEPTAEKVTSAHLDLGKTGLVAKNDKIWGYGLSNNPAPTVSLGCGGCHNVHGNNQYRILQKFTNTADFLVDSTAVPITAAYGETDRFFTEEAHSLVVGDIVTISGVTGLTPDFSAGAKWIVKAVAGNTFQVASVNSQTDPKSTSIENSITTFTGDFTATSGDNATVKRWASIVDDAPVPNTGDTRNYTVIQTKGTQGDNSKYLLYESQLLVAATTGTFNGITGTYTSTGGDYFHRTVPWNPEFVNPADNCNTYNYPTGTSVPASCATANDAPNGRPATVTDAGKGAIAYNDQISAWCSTCHTRYYSSTNTNPGIYEGNPADLEPASSAQAAKTIASASGTDILSPVNATSNNNFGYAVGDIVEFSATTGQYYVVYYATTGKDTAQYSTIRVSTTLDGAAVPAPASSGTVTRLYPFSSSSWYFERNGTDTSYKFQHQTTTNRACTTCHVGHGSDAQTTIGLTSYSNDLPFPDGTAATSGYNSRLLKVDNRGTCQACHDPTGLSKAGVVLGNTGADFVP